MSDYKDPPGFVQPVKEPVWPSVVSGAVGFVFLLSLGSLTGMHGLFTFLGLAWIWVNIMEIAKNDR